MSELTRKALEAVREHYTHDDLDGLVVAAVNMALRTLDAEERAEQAEADAQEAWTQATRTVDELDEARQEAAKLREALQDIARGPLQGPGDFEKYAQAVAVNALHSSDAPASEPEGIDVPEGTPTGDAHPLDDYPASADRSHTVGDCMECGKTVHEHDDWSAVHDECVSDGDYAREDSWIIDRGCIPKWSSPYYKDRPQTDAQREALDNLNRMESSLLELTDPDDRNDGVANIRKWATGVRQALSQSGQAVPDIIKRLPEELEWYAVEGDAGAPYHYAAIKVRQAIQIAEERALATHPADGDSPAVPDGYVLVPRDLTEAMVSTAEPAIDAYFEGTKDAPFEGSVRAVYRAMIAAAPTPDEDGE